MSTPWHHRSAARVARGVGEPAGTAPPGRIHDALLFAVVVLCGGIAATIAVGLDMATTPAAVVSWLALTVGVLLASAVALRRRRSLDRRVRMAEALARLGQLAVSMTEPEELLGAVATMAVQVLRADFGTAARRPGGSMLAVAVERGRPPKTAESGARPWEAGTLATAVLTSGVPMTSSDLRTDPRVGAPRSLLDRGVVSGVAVPLLGDTAAVGVLAVYSGRARRFTPTEVGVLQSMAAIAVTVLQQIDHREQLSHLAMHDPLTGLPNRALLMDRLEHALSRRPSMGAGGARVAVALIDLDHFKSVNDGLGHAAGDAVLREVGRRLASAVRPEDTLARFGGDEFALLCTSVADEQIAVRIAQRLVDACSQPLTVDGTSLTVTASAGITMTTGTPVPDADALLREADIALYRAKDDGGDRVELFRPAAEPRWAPPTP